MNILDTSAIEFVRQLKDQGLSVKDITSKLNELNFVSVTGKTLTDSNVSNFMCNNGMRTKEKVAKKVNDDAEKHRREINTIVLSVFNNSLLSKEQKIKTIESLL